MTKDGGFNRANKTGEKRAARFRKQMHWRQAGAETLRAFVDALTATGCAVMFSRTRDGGALALLVLCGDERVREYIANPEDISPILHELLVDYADGWEPGDPAPEQPS